MEFWYGNYRHLKTCYLDQITIIEVPDFKISTARDDSVKALELSGNMAVQFLPVETHRKFPKLVVYSASECSIKTLKKEHFVNLDFLVGIFMRKNQIETLNTDVFEDLQALEELDFSNLQFNLKVFASEFSLIF